MQYDANLTDIGLEAYNIDNGRHGRHEWSL